MVIVPPKLSVADEPFPLINIPAPVKAVLTVSIPVFVGVPVTATLPIEVMVEPLIVLAAPLKVCTPVPKALNVVALLVKLPPKL